MLWNSGCLLKKELSLSAGGEEKIIFLENKWCGDNPLCVVFPNLYYITSSKGTLAATVWRNQEEDVASDPNFLRSFNDWEMEEI